MQNEDVNDLYFSVNQVYKNIQIRQLLFENHDYVYVNNAFFAFCNSLNRFSATVNLHTYKWIVMMKKSLTKRS